MNTMTLRTCIALLVSLFLLAYPAFSLAQLTLSYQRPLTLSLSPENPGAGETVHLTIQSYAMDLDRSVVTWRANTAVIATGVGVKEATVVAGKLGETTLVTVDASDPDGNVASAEARIQPAEAQILWSSDSYAPPLYKGKTLAGTGATIRAYALVRLARPGGAIVPESDIIYTWYRNGTALVNISGRGKSSASFPGPAPLRADTIRVEAETTDRSLHTVASVVIPAADTILALYENHPLFGILFHRAIIGEVNTTEEEAKVTAIPYFAHISSPHDASLTYEWRLNDMPVVQDEKERETLTITAKDYTGPAAIELSLTNAADFLMRSTGAWKLIFGASTGIFFNGPGIFGE